MTSRIFLVPTAETYESIEILANSDRIRNPSTQDKVCNDECIYSFDTPYSPEGIFVNLATWLGYGIDYLKYDKAAELGAIYLNLRYYTNPSESAPKDASRLAIGVEGGFLATDEKTKITKECSIFIKAQGTTEVSYYKYSDLINSCSILLNEAIESVLTHQGAAEEAEVSTWIDDLQVPVSKYAEALPFLETNIYIANDPKTWKCAESGSVENLWLNLSTGYIGSGRKNWDGTGGSGAALRHFEETGRKYPLVVKLGTISPDAADVYSYAEDENCMVKDPFLAEHLSRWGINIMQQKKTEKTVAELELEMNKSYDFNKITEAGRNLELICGPRYTGLKNLGNSCYINSCLQILSSLLEIEETYGNGSNEIFRNSDGDLFSNFRVQTAKVISGLVSGKYSQIDQSNSDGTIKYINEAAPRAFRNLVGKGHPEFSTGRQQDAAEYMQYLLQLFEKSERSIGAKTYSYFQFRVQEKLKCLRTNMVQYRSSLKENILSLKIPLEAALNKAAVDAYQSRNDKRQKVGSHSDTDAEQEKVRPVVHLNACFENFNAEEEIDDFTSSAIQGKGKALKRSSIINFPRYLLIQLKQYYFDTSWNAMKLDVEVEMPEKIDINHLRAKGIEPGEVLLPDNEEKTQLESNFDDSSSVNVTPDETVVASMTAMGLSLNGSRRAAVATNNISTEAAMDWYFDHMNDPDLNDPLEVHCGHQGFFETSTVVELCNFGFSEKQVLTALKATSGNTERAADWLFSHSDDNNIVSEQISSDSSNSTGTMLKVESGVATPHRRIDYNSYLIKTDKFGETKDIQMEDGNGRYTLVGFISHIGKSLSGGHYVAHIKKEGRWILFNDMKVAVSEETPLRNGYLYLYHRDDASPL